jgi:hypothetical protein
MSFILKISSVNAEIYKGRLLPILRLNNDKIKYYKLCSISINTIPQEKKRHVMQNKIDNIELLNDFLLGYN